MAAAIKIRDKLEGKKVIIMITSGNVDLKLLKEIMNMKAWWEHS